MSVEIRGGDLERKTYKLWEESCGSGSGGLTYIVLRDDSKNWYNDCDMALHTFLSSPVFCLESQSSHTAA